MAKVSTEEIFDCDYSNLTQVIALAQKLGPGMSVIKRHDIPNYNITHTSRKDRLEGVEIVYQT